MNFGLLFPRWTVLVAGLLCVLLALFAARDYPDEDRTLRRCLSPGIPAQLVFLLLMLMHGVFTSSEPFLISSDEYCRADFAINWGIHPFFATHDAVWLPGQFYVMGALFKVADDMALVTKVVGLATSGAIIWFAGSLAFALIPRELSRVGAMILTGSHWLLMWSTASALGDAFLWSALLFALLIIVLVEVGPEFKPERVRLLPLAAAALALSNGFRYESWWVTAVFGVYLGLMLYRLWLGGNIGRFWMMPVVAGLIAISTPMGYMIGLGIDRGDPLAFLRHSASQNAVYGSMVEPFKSRIVAYPRILFQDHWELLVPGIVGWVLLVWRTGFRRVQVPAIALAGMLVIATVWAAVAGIASNTRPRYSMFLFLTVVPCAGAALGAGFCSMKPMLRRSLAPLLVVAAAVTMLYGFRTARVTYPSAWAEHPDVHPVAIRMKVERDWSRHEHAAPLVHPENVTVGVLAVEVPAEAWILRYHSRQPDRVIAFWDWGGVEFALANWEPGSRIIARGAAADLIATDDRVQQVMRIGSFVVFAVQRP